MQEKRSPQQSLHVVQQSAERILSVWERIILVMSDGALVAAVREVLREATASGAEVTARTVRHACERRLGLPPDGLIERKEELMGLISAELEGGQAAQLERRVDATAVREIQTALSDADGGPTRAALLVAELTSDGAIGHDGQEAMVLLAEACATSEPAARRLLDANVAIALAGLLPPLAPKPTCSLAVRLLSASACRTAVNVYPTPL